MVKPEIIKKNLELFRPKSSSLNRRLKSLLPSPFKEEAEVLSLFFGAEISSGDSDFLKKFLSSAQVPKRTGLVIMNGPGGDTIEAIQIGIILKQHFEKHLTIVIPRIAGSAMVYIALFADKVIIPPTNTYLTTVNNTVVSKKKNEGHRLIPNKILGSSEKEGYSVAICKKRSLELSKILNKKDVPEKLYRKLEKIREQLQRVMWKILEFSENTKGDLVENLFFEEKTLQHEFLERNTLIKNGFLVCEGKYNVNLYKVLREIHTNNSVFMNDLEIFYMIQYNSSIACKYYYRI